MPGSWELKSRRRVLCAILHVDQTTIAWSFGLRNLQLPGEVIGLSGMPYDHARNSACQMALQGGFSHLFFLDSDVIPPRDAVLRLLAHDRPLVCGMYSRRSPPHGVPVMIRNGKWVTDFAPNSLIEVDVIGAGCMLIRRDVLENLPPLDPKRGKTFFDWRVDMMGLLPPGEALSEDFAFCLAVRKTLGIPVLCDTSIQCKHVGLAEATYGSFVPCHANPVT